MSKKVLIAMSGGIDSSIAAKLLLEQGYEVVGATFRTYDSIREHCMQKEKGCCSIESIMEAKHLAEKLHIEHHIVDLRDFFHKTVIANFVSEYQQGRTPNPCVLCNVVIKWGAMLDFADELGCDFIATGHYARIEQRRGHVFLKMAADLNKDQTYFLWRLTEDKLKRTIFPLGDLQKKEVRILAAKYGLDKLNEKRESQEICFIPNNDYRTFLRNEGCRIGKGHYVDTSGRILGEHSGFANYTIGQRKGLGIAFGTPRFVTHIDAATNTVTLGQFEDLLTRRIEAKDGHWIDEGWLNESPNVDVRIRYRSKPMSAWVILHYAKGEGDKIVVETEETVWGVTPGQSLVLYKDGLVVGGAIIS